MGLGVDVDEVDAEGWTALHVSNPLAAVPYASLCRAMGDASTLCVRVRHRAVTGLATVGAHAHEVK